MKKLKKILLISVGSIASIIFILLLVLLVKSPGKPIPFIDSNGNKLIGSISLIEEIKLGGLKQHLIIRGKDSLKPIMLFLHGGPGSPEFPFMKNPKLNLEENFVMIYWEQRGAGMSYSKDIPITTMNLQQLISDTQDLSLLLAKRFRKEKIYLMGHSWGTLLGLLTVDQRPELFHAYMGVGQVCNQYEAEKISLKWVRSKAIELKDEKASSILSKLDLPKLTASNKDWLDYLMIQREYVNQYGGGMTREVFNSWSSIREGYRPTKLLPS